MNGRRIAEYTIAFKEASNRWPRYSELYKQLVEKTRSGDYICSHRTFVKYFVEAQNDWGLTSGYDKNIKKKIWFVNEKGMKELQRYKRLKNIVIKLKSMTEEQQEWQLAKLELELTEYEKKDKMLKLSSMELPFIAAIKAIQEKGLKRIDSHEGDTQAQNLNIPSSIASELENVKAEIQIIREIEFLGLRPDIEIVAVPKKEVYQTSVDGSRYFKKMQRFGWKKIMKATVDGNVILGRYVDIGHWAEEQIEKQLLALKKLSNVSEERWNKVSDEAREALLDDCEIAYILALIRGNFEPYFKNSPII